MNSVKSIPYNDEGTIIIISAVVSSITGIFVNNIMFHTIHPEIFASLGIGLTLMFGAVLVFFRKK